ncbi:ATP-binding protein [Methanolobus sp.]|uniref:ATP-binding protein n=1 Tax=Methanolobus sp. TaxID=1874737 RepID=UPI0025D86B9C|nr:ATP-binding protein [Methanolobus sp.]
MNAEILLALINNAALLLAIGVLYEVLFFNMDTNTRFKGIAAGIIIGLIGIALMLNPWELSPGLFFDTRTILLSIVGLFFGFIPAVVGALIISCYRLYEGGVGTIVGIATTVSSMTLGLLWRQFHDRFQKLFGKFDLYFFGILVHIVMLICILLLPWPFAFEVLSHISFPVMLIYPIGTVLLGSLLKNQLSRKETQVALKENEEKLQNFIDNVPVGIFRTSSEGKIVQVNPEMAHIVGQSTPEQAISYLQDMDENYYVDPNCRKELINFLKTKGYVENFEYEALRADGKHIWLLMNARTSDELKGGSFVINGFILDITERKRVDEALKQAERKYRRAYNLMQGVIESPEDVVIFALDGEYRYLAFNKNHQITMENIWEAKIEVGVSMLNYIRDPADREKAKVNFDRALAGEAFTLIEEYGDLLFERRWYENVYSPLEDDEGSVIGITLFLSDITERKQTEMALIQARALAEESNRIKSEFIANMSHELRTPLNSIIGFSQILTEEIVGNLNEKQVKYVSNIQKSGNHLLGLINDILDISKIESGNMKYEPDKINLQQSINEAILLMEPMIKTKLIDFKFNTDLKNLETYADKIKIKQIMYNLLSNAIKFTPKNGKVWIDSKLINNKIQISVSDNGIGIPLDEQKTIFDSFKQVDSSENRVYGGTGLGLAIVKHYVEMHSGEIHVESEVGKGSTFTFTIPIDTI